MYQIKNIYTWICDFCEKKEETEDSQSPPDWKQMYGNKGDVCSEKCYKDLFMKKAKETLANELSNRYSKK